MFWALVIYLLLLLLLCLYLIYLIIRLLPLVLFARQPLPFVPISHRAAKIIAELPELEGKKTMVDLGCGRGHLLAAIRKRHPTAELFGVEYNHTLIAMSRRRLQRQGIKVIEGDMFAYDITQMDVIVGWWIGGDFIKKLLPKFVAECKPGCVIVSYMFPLPAHPRLVERVVRVGKERVYVYCITPALAGEYRLKAPARGLG